MNIIEVDCMNHKVKVIDPSTYSYGTNSFSDPEPIMPYWKIKPEEIVIDCGAAFGCYTLAALAQGAIVHAFEPSDSIEILTKNVKLNGWEKRCHIYKSVLWDGTEYPETLLRDVFCRSYPSKIPLTYSTLDSYKLNQISMMKLDVEGAELGLIRGGLNTINQFKPTLLIEDHDGISPGSPVSDYPASIGSSRQIHNLLQSIGYEIIDIRHQISRKYITAFYPK